MAVEVILPKVDMDMAQGRIARWLVAEGDRVRRGDPLFEMETDKAAMEVESPADGIVRGIAGGQDEVIPVGRTVAWIAADGEEQPVRDRPASDAASSSSLAGDSRRQEESAVAPSSVLPGGPLSSAEISPSQAGRTRASPLARRLAKEAGVDVASISGSGPHGRVVKADVEAASAGGGKAAGPAAAGEAGKASVGKGAGAPPAPQPMADAAVLKLFAEGSYELIPHDSMRRTIARRLVEAKATVPHFYLTLDCAIDALLALRRQLNDAAPVRKGEKGEAPAWKLSVNDLVIKAWAMALKAVPEANVSWTEGGMLKHRHADVGVAVSIPGGLITPIVRRAEEKTLSAISNEMKDLAARARTRKLKPDEYQGGTSAVSNLGMFGIKDFAAVINPPHATILAVGAGEERAVVRGGQIVAATVMSVTLSTDHRAVDGALGAELLAAFKTIVEKPMGMLA